MLDGLSAPPMTVSRAPGFYLSTLFAALSLATHAADITPMEVMDFTSLQKLAAQMALKPYVAPAQQLDPFFEGLKYDGHRKIRFLRDKALFADVGDVYRVEFFHPGWMFKKPVVFHNIQGIETKGVPFNRSFFDYDDLKVPEKVISPAGYAGFRVLAPDSLLKKPFEFMVFMGASYYRAVTTELGYGISARGVAVNTIAC